MMRGGLYPAQHEGGEQSGGERDNGAYHRGDHQGFGESRARRGEDEGARLSRELSRNGDGAAQSA